MGVGVGGLGCGVWGAGNSLSGTLSPLESLDEVPDVFGKEIDDRLE